MSEKMKRRFRFADDQTAMAFWGRSIGIALGHKSGGVTYFNGEQNGRTVTVEFLQGALGSILVAAKQYSGKEVKIKEPQP